MAPKRFPDRAEIAAVREECEPLEAGQAAEASRRIAGRAMARRDMGMTRLEALLGNPVYLDCWVKVLPNWRRNAASLSRLGFPEDTPAS